MPVRGEVHSFSSALARDEIVRLLEGSTGFDAGTTHLLIEHLEGCARQKACETLPGAVPPSQKVSRRRITLSFPVHPCEFLLRAVRWGTRSEDTYRGLRR